MAVSHAKQKYPNSAFGYSLGELINAVGKIAGASACATAAAAATNIATLLSGLRGLSVHAKYKAAGTGTVELLCQALQAGYNEKRLGTTDSAQDTVIAAFTTWNTASAATDVLYAFCTQHEAAVTSSMLGTGNMQPFPV